MGRTLLALLVGVLTFVVVMSILNPATAALRPDWFVQGTDEFAPTNTGLQWVGIAENMLAGFAAGVVAALVAGRGPQRHARWLALVLLVLLAIVGAMGVRNGHWLVWRAAAQAALVPLATYLGGVVRRKSVTSAPA